MENYFKKQDYRKYTKEDKSVWSELFTRQTKLLKEKNAAFPLFANGLNRLGINEEIPNLNKINEALKKVNSSYIVEGVDGIVPDKVFFEMLRNGVFPVTTWVRSRENMDYLEEPDMFHDLYGHVPFLVNPNYCKFLKKVGDYAEEIFESDDKERKDKMSRLYWYTVEFGLIKKPHRNLIYGAGIISSFEETNKIIENDNIEISEFSDEFLNSEFKKDELQTKYATIDGALFNLLNIELNF